MAQEYVIDNELFVKAAQDNLEGLKAKTQDYVRIRLYDEKGIARTVLDATPITWDELDKDINNSAYKIVDLEGDRQIAMTVPFTAEIATRYVNLPQVKFPIEEIDTEEYIKNMTEIKFLHHSFADEIENSARKGIQHREDAAFIGAANAAAVLAGQAINIPAAPGQTYFYKDNFVTLKKIMLTGENPLRVDLFLMHESTWEDIQNWNTHEFNSEVSRKVTVEGLDFDTLLGVRVLTTLSTDLVPQNVVYAFAPVENLGLMRILEDVTLFMKKEKKDLRYWFTEQLVMGIANVNAISRMILV